MKAPRKNAEGSAAIAAGTSIRGELRGDEDLVIHGRLEGSLDLGSGLLRVERGAVVIGDVRAASAYVAGAVVGGIQAQELIQLAPTARVIGDLRAGRVVLEAGAQLAGQLDTAGDATAAQSTFEPAPAPEEPFFTRIDPLPEVVAEPESAESEGPRRRRFVKVRRRIS